MIKASKKIQKSDDEYLFDNKQKQNRGKPPKLGETTLMIPNIWTNALDNKCLELVAKLQSWGRHCCIHPAGKKGKKEKEKKADKERLDGEKKYYEIAERIAEEDFKNSSNTKRCVVFFFRRPGDLLSEINLDQYRLDDNGYKLIQYVTCLLNQRFITELAEILSPQQNEQQLALQFLKKGMNFSMEEYPQTVQNAYIKFIISEMIQGNINSQLLEDSHNRYNHFQQFIDGSAGEKIVFDFIREIRSIIINAETNYETEHQVIEIQFNE